MGSRPFVAPRAPPGAARGHSWAVTRPPELPFSGWFTVALLVGGMVYLLLRTARHGHGWAARIGVVAGAFFALLAPAAAVLVTQDLTCRDGGVLERPSGALIVVAVTGLALVWLLAMFWVAGDRAGDFGRRLAVVPPALLVPVAIVELMGPLLPLEHYCDGLRGVIHLQGALALLVPVAAIGLALVRSGPPVAADRVTKPLVLVSAVGVLLAQVAVLTDRLPPAPVACVTRQPLPRVGPGLVAADFDGDGDVDLVSNGSARRQVMLVNRGGGQFDVVMRPTMVWASQAQAADVDDDGLLDLVLSVGFVSTEVDELGFLYVRRGRGDVSFGDPQRLGTPQGLLAVADLNGDGRADYVVDEFRSVAVLMSREC